MPGPSYSSSRYTYDFSFTTEEPEPGLRVAAIHGAQQQFARKNAYVKARNATVTYKSSVQLLGSKTQVYTYILQTLGTFFSLHWRQAEVLNIHGNK